MFLFFVFVAGIIYLIANNFLQILSVKRTNKQPEVLKLLQNK